MKYSISIFFIYFLLYNKRSYSIIVLPFQINELKEREVYDDEEENDAELNYSVNDYFSDFIQADYYSSIFLGEKNIQILARISIDNSTFILSEEECNRKSIENAENYLIMTRNSYKIGLTTSYKNIYHMIIIIRIKT